MTPGQRSPGAIVRLTAAQALVRYLARQHSVRDGRRQRLVPGVFGIFGHGNVAGLGQALDSCGHDLPYFQARNEQSMVHLAVGFAKASRRTRTLACTSSIGPGSTNMVTGAALATIGRLPVLLLPSDTYATRRQGPVLQQLEHPSYADVSVNDAFRPVARFFDRIVRPEQLLTALPEAMRVLTSPSETGAVVVALPQDVQSEAYDYPAAFFEERQWPIHRPRAEPERLDEVAGLLARARRPLVIAGGGVRYSEAEAELEALARDLGVPVAETFGGKGAVTEHLADVPWWAVGGIGLEGNPAANRLAAGADLVVAVGTRLTDFITASHSLFQNPEVTFASVNVTDADARKLDAVPVVGDAREALRGLREAALRAGARPAPDRERWVREATTAWQPVRAGALAPPSDGTAVLTQGQLIGMLQEEARPGDTILTAAGGPPGDLLKVWDPTGGRHCHLEFGYSCMGYELPAALGVRLAQRDGEVTALIGDGTFLMQPSELVTAAQEGLKATIVISENHGFQCIRRLQMLRAGRHFGNEFRYREDPVGRDGRLEGPYVELDLAGVARGLGVSACAVSGADQLRRALREARDASGPVVIVVSTVPHHDLPPSGAWWDVAPAEVSEQEWVRERREQYEADRVKLQRFYG